MNFIKFSLTCIGIIGCLWGMVPTVQVQNNIQRGNYDYGIIFRDLKGLNRRVCIAYQNGPVRCSIYAGSQIVQTILGSEATDIFNAMQDTFNGSLIKMPS